MNSRTPKHYILVHPITVRGQTGPMYIDVETISQVGVCVRGEDGHESANSEIHFHNMEAVYLCTDTVEEVIERIEKTACSIFHRDKSNAH